MRYIRNGQILLVITLGMPFAVWGQGGRAGRAAAAQQGAAPATAPGTPAAPLGWSTGSRDLAFRSSKERDEASAKADAFLFLRLTLV